MSDTRLIDLQSMVPTEAAASAARFVERDWGSYGYRIGGAVGRSADGFWHFPVLASDGSYFEVGSDRYGNTRPVVEADNIARY